MMIILTGPACVLSFVLAHLCYRADCYRQTVVLTAFAVFMLILTLGLFGAGYYTWGAFQAGVTILC